MANSYNGWPASPDPRAIGLVPLSVAGSRPFGEGGFPGGVVGGPVHTVFSVLVYRLHTEVEPMMTKDGQVGYGCWAYTYRANVNNPSQLSCHASGTAIDYNAVRHPNGTSTGPGGGGGWSGDQYRKIQGILADLGGVIRWLKGNDPMHFEIYGNAAAVAAVAARLSGPDKPEPPTGPTKLWLSSVIPPLNWSST